MPPDPLPRTLAALARREQACERCDLHRITDHAVPGEGPPDARLLLLGEQPGDREDRAGAPFVGPAGRMLDDALEAAGVDRSEVFLTNAVKRFRHVERATGGGGKRRIHKKPTLEQVRACRVWLDAELTLVRPRLVVCLGATAVQTMLGSQVRLGDVRGQIVEPDTGPPSVLSTGHPSAILRVRDRAERHELFDMLVADLVVARDAAAAASPGG